MEFSDPELLALALTHRSYAHEFGTGENNERLEILGDAVLGLCITEMLYKRFPDYQEGNLAKLRASLVSTVGLADVAAEIRLGEALRLGRGEEHSGGRSKPSILADCLEAVIGAVHVDRGITTARKLVRTLFGPRISSAHQSGHVPKDAKTRLQELAAARWGVLPEYSVTSSGPDHAPKFTAKVAIQGENAGTGAGRSKKEAQRAAAASALARFEASATGEPPISTSRGGQVAEDEQARP